MNSPTLGWGSFSPRPVSQLPSWTVSPHCSEREKAPTSEQLSTAKALALTQVGLLWKVGKAGWAGLILCSLFKVASFPHIMNTCIRGTGGRDGGGQSCGDSAPAGVPPSQPWG